ncbi:hypothetical protein RBB50_005038 [Rhinocladiella similis]
MASESTPPRHSSFNPTQTDRLASLQEEMHKVLDTVEAKFGLDVNGRQAFNKALQQTKQNADGQAAEKHSLESKAVGGQNAAGNASDPK